MQYFPGAGRSERGEKSAVYADHANERRIGRDANEIFEPKTTCGYQCGETVIAVGAEAE